jgi:hypothetical protein
MKTLYSNIRLVFSGDTVLLGISIMGFLASVANATQWPVLHSFRFCGICTFLLSSTFLLFTAMDLAKHERRKRTIVAAMFFLATVVVCLSGTRIVIDQGQ